MEAPLSVTAILKSSEFTSFINEQRKRQSSRELATFLLDVANLPEGINEEKARLVLHAVFRAYRQSSKLKGGALVGRLVRVFAKPLLNNGDLCQAILDEPLKEDADKSYSETTRNLAFATFHDVLGAQLPPLLVTDKTDDTLYFIFSEVITTDDHVARTHVLNALLEFLKNDLDACVRRLSQCPDYIREAFKAFSPTLRQKITDAETVAALPRAFSPEELLKRLMSPELAACLAKYVRENMDKNKNSAYPPAGQFLIDLIERMRLFSSAENPIKKARPILECLYLLVTDLLNEEKFPRKMTKKFGKSELIPALIDGFCPILLSAAALGRYKEIIEDPKTNIGKRFSVPNRAELLTALQTAIKSILLHSQEALPQTASPLGRIISLVLDEKTDLALRKNMLEALKEYYLCLFKGGNSFETSQFAALVLACDNTQACMPFTQLDAVPRPSVQKIQTEETERAKAAAKLLAEEAVAKVAAKTAEGGEDQQAARDKKGVSSFMQVLKRSSKAGAAVDASQTNSPKSTPTFGRRKADDAGK
ncbi:MAG TPA: hypothetical protein VGV92_09645 [Gammaproteobacteria bacterium]|nr:hypothetical protein [Gammaproteobacteria bacterium]